MVSNEKIIQSALATFANEAHAVAELANTVDMEAYVKAVRMIASCRGHIITSGCGTSGAAAKKISQVFNCVDRASQFLNPADAPHGDYGMIREGDIIIIISKGGKTVEMERLIPVARTRGASIIVCTENPEAPIVRDADVALILSTGPEAEPEQCLSTTSVTAVFALFDAISINCMMLNGIGREYFKTVHPAGGVGAMLAAEE
ncbi:MAG: SIS domain-containing protein [Lachnospiraceae bacterium]|nr:SIS domain-containing protein [Lachnospiraceae bacterium]